MADLVRNRHDAFGRVDTPRHGVLIAAIAGVVLVASTAQSNPLGIALGLGLFADRYAKPKSFLLSPSTALLAGLAPSAPYASGILSLLFAVGRWFGTGGAIPIRPVADAALITLAALFGSLVASAPLGGVLCLAAIYALEMLAEEVFARIRRRHDAFEIGAIWNESSHELLARLVVATIAGGCVAHGATIYLLMFAAPLGFLAAAERARARRRRDRTAMLQALSGMLQYAHPYTLGHMQRVGEMAERVGRRMGLGEIHGARLGEAALLHDIGKLAIDEEILESARKLTDLEWAQVKTHAALGAEILASADPRDPAIAWVRHHHERVDGRGYPDGLSGEAIPMESRIIAVIDAYDAMTGAGYDSSFRRYQPPVNSAEARLELRRCAGTQFDPAVVEAFERVLEEELV